MRYVVLCIWLCVAAPVYAQEPVESVALATTPDTAAATPIATTQEQLLANALHVAQAITDAAKAQKAARETATNKGKTWVAIAGALAVFFTLILGFFRKYGTLLLNEQVLRLVTMVLAVGIWITTQLAGGVPEYAAILFAASAPFSMVIWAIIDLCRPGAWKQATERAAAKIEARKNGGAPA